MSNDPKLPKRLDTASARQLAETLQGLRGQPATIDGSAVQFGGALGLQVLVAANHQWQADGQPFRIAPLSGALHSACRVLGIEPAEIGAAPDMETEENT